MTRNIEQELILTMQKLEETADRVARTNGYTREAKKIRLLVEMIKEQIRNENSVPATRPAR